MGARGMRRPRSVWRTRWRDPAGADRARAGGKAAHDHRLVARRLLPAAGHDRQRTSVDRRDDGPRAERSRESGAANRAVGCSVLAQRRFLKSRKYEVLKVRSTRTSYFFTSYLHEVVIDTDLYRVSSLRPAFS